MYCSIDSLPLFLTVEDIMGILQIGRNSAYELCRSMGFPTMRLGRNIRIPKDKFIEWYKNSTENN